MLASNPAGGKPSSRRNLTTGRALGAAALALWLTGNYVPVARALDDRGTPVPSESGTGRSQEDEPVQGPDGAPQDAPGAGSANPSEEAPGCPVRDRGPFPMLV